jgi:hypothetical protein
MLKSRAALGAWICVAIAWASQAQATAGTQPQRPIAATKTAAPAPDDLLQQLVVSARECPAFAKLASDYRARFSAPMQAWAEQHLARLDARKVIYPFSGADIVTAMNLFASADHLVLVADQWPQHGAPASILPQQVAKECQTMSFFARYGYFRTHDLEGKDSVRPRFARLLAYSIALTEAQVGRVEYLALQEDGQVRPTVDAVKPDGLRFAVTRANGRALTIDYVRTDLSNNGLKVGSRSHTFMRSQMDAVVLLKSASHLLQKPHFSALAELTVERAPSVVQDETGLDIEPFRRAFEIRSYGKFHAPHPLWHDSASGQRLIRYLQDQPAIEPLPFTIGYEKKSGSVLLVGTRNRR